ncbi:apolipoprotein D-like [Macrosteles quadrilineatus]|uniref:apolipoprotein D-like n=1 Tax=Macrosteles quadrilineatus TaxID=74068 RepID=UPI0023E321FC|nr:apolipoprotein D-like [Macrosteles quadrilineatus]
MCVSRLVVLVTVSVLVYSAVIVRSQRPGFGRCPDYPAVKNFDVMKFQGEWYEVERSFYILELVTGCTTLNFTARPDNVFKVAIKTANKWNGNIMIGLLGTATPNRYNRGELQFKIDSNLPPALVRALPGVGNYKVLGTDYDSFALLYSCSDMGILHADLLWVLARAKELPVTSRVQVYDIMSTLNIDPARLTLTKHNKCPQF